MPSIVMSLAEANDWLAAQLVGKAQWLALHSTEPGRTADVASEIVGGGYARQRVSLGPPSGGKVTNTNNVAFANLPNTSVSYLALWSQQVGGQMRLYLPIARQNFAGGQTMPVPVGDLAIAL